MKIPFITGTITSRLFSKSQRPLTKLNKTQLAKEKARILNQEILKRRIESERELHILPELNFLGLPKWM